MSNRCSAMSAIRSCGLLAVVCLWLPAVADDPQSISVASWIKQQIQEGRLKVEFYDRAKPPKPYPGWTDFEFRMEFQYDYQAEFVNRTAKKARRGVVAVIPSFTKIKISVTHQVLLPKSLESDHWYETGLGQHELEHVRVGSHPRLVMLINHLVKKVNRFERDVQTPEEIARELVSKLVNDEVTARKNAIQSLVAEINRHIDDVTNHGATVLEDREQFFSSLFLKENLDKHKFPYLSEVLDLVETRDYRDAKVPALFTDADEKSVSKKTPLK